MDPQVRPAFITPGATAGQSSDDVAALLQSRLRTLGILLLPLGLILAALGIAGGLFTSFSRPFVHPPYIGWPLVWGAALGILALTRLGPRRPLALGTLRMWEAIGIGSGVVIFTIGWYLLLSKVPAATRQALGDMDPLMGPQILAAGGSVFWVSTMIAYGTYVPNTWRRCAIAMALMSVCAVVPDLIVIRGWSVPASFQFSYFGGRLFWLVDAALIAIYGAKRIESLRSDAAAARRLGQYVLTSPLGSGGMGDVFVAQHQFLRRPCAVKLIRPGEHADSTAISRFEREVQTTAALTHPNAVQIFDYGRAEDGTFFYAMEYLPGPSLEQIVEEHGPLSPARAVQFLRQICGPLEEAHRLGLIHRDVKPSNVIVCERGGVPDVAKLLDFGLVADVGKPVGDGDARLTQAGTIVGSPAFMSPEQCAGDELTLASDIYSVGALGYYLVTGKSPFAGRSATQMLAAHIYEVPSSPSSKQEGVPSQLDAVILRCLAKQPSERYSSAAELERALAALR